MIAVLLALGMLVISVQAPDLATPDTAAMVADATDELPPVMLVDVPRVVPDQREAETVLPTPAIPAGHSPELSVFRPPRVAAFA